MRTPLSARFYSAAESTRGAGLPPAAVIHHRGTTSFGPYFFGGLGSYFGLSHGRGIARHDAIGNVYDYAEDSLGSSRTIVTSSGSTRGIYPEHSRRNADFYPGACPERSRRGGEQSINDPCPQNYKFALFASRMGLRDTGKERDSESGFDNFGARYYSSGSSLTGRFLSPDPVVITPERFHDPQQLNEYAYVRNNPLRFTDPTGEVLTLSGNLKEDYQELCKIAGSACGRLKVDKKTGNVAFDTKGLDLSKNEGAALIGDLVTSKNTYEFSNGPAVETANGLQKVSFITNLPSFGDQPNIGQPRAGVSDVAALYLNNPNITQVSNTSLKVALDWTVAFHELAEAYQKIDAGRGGSYAAGHNAALQQETILRDQRPYLEQYNTGAGGPANSPNPEGGIIIKQ